MKNRKIKTYSKTIASQNILCINAIVYYFSSFVLFLKTCTRDKKSNFENFWFRLYGLRKMLVFYFSFNHFDDFLTTFAKDLMKKPPVLITNIKSSFIINLYKDLRSSNETTVFFKKWKNYAFWRLILRNVKRKKFWILWICQIWWDVSFLKLRAVELAILEIMYEIMRTFDIRYENGWFFHRSLVKAVRNRQTNETLKTSVLDSPSDQIQKFSKLHFYYDSKNLAEITQFNVNTEISRQNAFLCNFHKSFKGPSFHCQKFVRSQIFTKM